MRGGAFAARNGDAPLLDPPRACVAGRGRGFCVLCSALSKHRRVLQRFSRSVDSLVRETLALGWKRADKAVRAPLAAAWPHCVPALLVFIFQN